MYYYAYSLIEWLILLATLLACLRAESRTEVATIVLICWTAMSISALLAHEWLRAAWWFGVGLVAATAVLYLPWEALGRRIRALFSRKDAA